MRNDRSTRAHLAGSYRWLELADDRFCAELIEDAQPRSQWFVVGYGEALEVLRSPSLSVSSAVDALMEVRPYSQLSAETKASFVRWLLFVDPPDHTRLPSALCCVTAKAPGARPDQQRQRSRHLPYRLIELLDIQPSMRLRGCRGARRRSGGREVERSRGREARPADAVSPFGLVRWRHDRSCAWSSWRRRRAWRRRDQSRTLLRSVCAG
jgi:hypothetical protein